MAHLNQLAGEDDSAAGYKPTVYDGIALPSLLTLPDEPNVLAKSAAPMAVLLQALCERGQAYQCVRALYACYLEPSLAPLEVVWLVVQATGIAAQPNHVTDVLSAVLLTQPLPAWLTPARGMSLLRLGILHALPQVCETAG